MTSPLILVESNDTTQVLAEDNGSAKDWYIKGIFLQANIKNGNNRVYPKKVLSEAVNVYRDRYMSRGAGYGELGHPTEPGIHENNVCILTKEVHEDGDNFIGKAKVINTPSGLILQEFLRQGVQVGVSSRGRAGPGGIKNGIVQEGFRLVTMVDVVTDPSAPDAFVTGLMEKMEWVWDNGILVEREIEQMHNSLASAKSADIAERQLAVFQTFFDRVKFTGK